MTYFPTGADDVSPAALATLFCSPDNVREGCVPTAGTAKPMSKECLARFKAFQAQVNRLSVGLGIGSICIDGWIGPETMRALKDIPARVGWPVPPGVNVQDLERISKQSLRDLGFNAQSYTVLLRGYADALGIPATAPSKACTSPGVYTGKKSKAPAVPAPAAPIEEAAAPPPSTGLKLTDPLVLAAAGVVALLLFTGKKKS